MFELEIETLTSLLKEAFQELDIPVPETVAWNPTPFSGQWGIGTAARFQAAAAEARDGKPVVVPRRAEEIALQVVERMQTPPNYNRIVADRAYINAYFDTAIYAQKVVDTTLAAGLDFGRGSPKSERVMVEFAQPNTHHSFHIGHTRNAILGESLARLVEFNGFDTIRASYPGDIGLGVITTIWAYQKFYAGQEPKSIHARGQWLANIYAEATALLTPKDSETQLEIDQRTQYENERRELYQAWDAGDPDVRQLWHDTRQWSLDELKDILEDLGAVIDVYFFESEVDEPAKAIVQELIRLGIAEDERPEGPVIVKIDEKLGLEKEKYRTGVILRSDGTTLYLTKDLALAKQKFEEFNVDRSIYVVDVRQSLHFQQAFKILELWGFKQSEKCYHLAYGYVSLPEGTMSSRHGTIIFYKDVADEAVQRVLKVIAEKNPDMPMDRRNEIAHQIGLGALAYTMLSVDNSKDIVFDWDTALSFDGQTAPYIQNAHVRANSILRKAGRLPEEADYSYKLAILETDLIDHISRFPQAVEQAAADYKPLIIANYAYELAKTFHAFYHSVPVLKAGESKVVDARLRLTAAAKQTLANSLRLLTIEAPDVM